MAASASAQLNVHGTAIAAGRRAVLIRGPSGSGKSDLALRAIATGQSSLVSAPAMLVADDRVIVQAEDGGLSVTAPAALLGLLEVRGVGIVRVPVVGSARLVLVADLVPPDVVERLPDDSLTAELIPGWPVRRIAITPFEASAPIKLLMALAS